MKPISSATAAKIKYEISGGNINSIMQQVFRETYIDGREDLIYRAEKVKATNALKKRIRAQIEVWAKAESTLATGGTANAAAKLIEISKGNVAGFIFVINLFDLGGCDNLRKNSYKVENLIEFPGH